MEHMVHVKMIHVLSADYIDFAVPLFVQGLQLLQLLQLPFGEFRKVGGKQGAWGSHYN
jgi:hypothetical protein